MKTIPAPAATATRPRRARRVNVATARARGKTPMDTLEALHAQGVDLTGIQAALQRLLDEHGLDDGRRYSCPLTASTRAIGALYIGRRRQAWDRVAHLNSSALGCASADTADEDTTAMVWAVLQDEVGMLSF